MLPLFIHEYYVYFIFLFNYLNYISFYVFTCIRLLFIDIRIYQLDAAIAYWGPREIILRRLRHRKSSFPLLTTFDRATTATSPSLRPISTSPNRTSTDNAPRPRGYMTHDYAHRRSETSRCDDQHALLSRYIYRDSTTNKHFLSSRQDSTRSRRVGKNIHDVPGLNDMISRLRALAHDNNTNSRAPRRKYRTLEHRAHDKTANTVRPVNHAISLYITIYLLRRRKYTRQTIKNHLFNYFTSMPV